MAYNPDDPWGTEEETFENGLPKLPTYDGAAPAPDMPTTTSGGWETGTGTKSTTAASSYPAPTMSGGYNTYGTSVDLSDAYLDKTIGDYAASVGYQFAPLGDGSLQYWKDKVRSPEEYSDNRFHVGWNDYWADRMRTGSSSSNPALAGDAGWIRNPSQYGLMSSAGNSVGGFGNPALGGMVQPGTSVSMGNYESGPVWDAIQRLLARGEDTPDRTDPAIRAASSSYRAGLDRANRRSRHMLAERAAAEGLNSGGAGSGYFDSALQSQEEGAGIQLANFESGLVLDEIKQRRQDVVNALQLAQGSQRMQLQQQLALLNDALQRAQMGQQNTQFYDSLAYGMGRDTQQMNLNYLALLAGLN